MSLNKIETCPICNHQEYSLYLSCNDYTVSNEKFDIVECKGCHFRFTNPIPTENEIGEYYKSEDYISHSGTKKGLINSIYHKVRNYTIKQKFKLVSSFVKEQSILDIGCGTGEFLNFCKQKGWNALGLEPSESARKLGKENFGIEMKDISEIANVPDNSYGAISMWHVLEHVYHLQDTVKHLKRIIKKDGTIFIAVPNHSSYDAQLYKEQWAAYDLPIHLYHFVPRDIRLLFSNFDMEVVKVIPMKFDSYYVSMLSENYVARDKGQVKGSVLKGFWNGLVSNLKADNEHYSSQIYVIKNKS